MISNNYNKFNRHISNEEFLQISRELEIYHSIFSKIWSIGRPQFSDEIPTACITFNTDGHYLNFLFNPTFWDNCSQYERIFIICHECLHVILNHGIRLKELDRDIGNVSADVVINEMLINGFNFDRTKLNWIDKNGCWLNTVFTNKNQIVESNRSLEYYYNILYENVKKNIEQSLENGNLKIIDNHDELINMDPTNLNDIVNDILNTINDIDIDSLGKILNEITPDEFDKCNKQAGTMAGNLKIIIDVKKVNKKRKWESVIKNWANNFIKILNNDHEQWARVNRRFSSFINSSKGLFLPSEMEIEEREKYKKRIKVIFFQDTSGSCHHFAKRFFTAAKSLPTDRFDIELYCFDTKVYKTSLKSRKLYGFGGTSFSILEEKIIDICNGNLKNYPKAIFVITDGCGNFIHPKKPKHWYWFLSGNTPRFIPSECNIYKLSEFE